MASSSAATQKSASIVFDSREARTLRLAQSMLATRYKKPRAHRDIRHIGTPDVIWPLDDEVAQQIGIDPVLRVWVGRAWLLIDRLKPDLPHQSANTLAPNAPALATKVTHHSA